MNIVKFIVDASLSIESHHYTQSIIYIDENNIERVACSACLHHSKLNPKQDLTWDEYRIVKSDLGFKNLIVINQTDYDNRLLQYKKFRSQNEKLISKSKFEEQLHCLPPQRWTRLVSTEFFHMEEFLTLNLVSWFGKIGSRYFEIIDQSSTDLKTIRARFEALASYSMGFLKHI